MADDEKELEEAIEALDLAVREVVRLKGWTEQVEGSSMLLSDWVMLFARQGYDSSGGGVSQVGYLLQDDHMPWYRVIGLVRHAQLVIEADLGEEMA